MKSLTMPLHGETSLSSGGLADEVKCPQRPRRPRGFTLIEIMIVVIILGLLAVMAIPNLSRARETAQQTACNNNMRQIDAAKQRWALEGGKTGADTPTEEELEVFIRFGFPTCSAQGTYVIGNANTSPSCNVHGEF